MFYKIAITLGVIGLLAGCKAKKDNKNIVQTNDVKITEEPVGLTIPMSYGYNRDLLNTSINPCDNFYQFAAGGWLERNMRPQTESRWSTFNVINKENEQKLIQILRELGEQDYTETGTIEQQAADLFYGFQLEEMIESYDLDPIKDLLEELNEIKSVKELPELLAKYKKLGITSLFSFYVSIDAKNSSQNAVYLGQGGLGLPDRDYYFKTDSASLSILADYQKYIANLLALGNEKNIEKKAREMFNLEKALANLCMTRTESRDPNKTYNPFKFEDFSKENNYLDWNRFIHTLDISKLETIIVSNPTYFKGLGNLIAKTPIDVWKTYFKFHILNSYADVLPNRYAALKFGFYQTKLSGISTMKSREERAIALVNGQFGEPLGQLFVKHHFSENSKKMVAEMVEFLREAFRIRITELDWMSSETKNMALQKLAAFTYKIGYPDKWKDYSQVKVERDALIKSLRNISNHQFEQMIAKIGEPVDKTEWGMSPQTVNAYYSPTRNEIVFPAGILQPPFFHPNADIALNYGGIGAVIGHEFSHGFDDKGSKYDAYGNLKNWWNDDDIKLFQTKTEAIVQQFNNYEPLPGYKINGELTQGENIADNAGLTMAYLALKLHHAKRGFISEPEDGFNWKQRFFLSWANVWVNHITDAELKKRLVTDSHSPGEYRVNGPLSQLPEFKEAFDCPEKSKMNPNNAEPVRIW